MRISDEKYNINFEMILNMICYRFATVIFIGVANYFSCDNIFDDV
ncbi:MAG: hypothetical protein RR948_15100 [Clostridium sp.]